MITPQHLISITNNHHTVTIIWYKYLRTTRLQPDGLLLGATPAVRRWRRWDGCE
jgi:hypothetical protein